MFLYLMTGILVIISLVVQGHSSFDVIRIADVKPDILFIFILYLSYSFGSFYGEVTAFMGGLLHDAVSNAPLGLLTLPKVIIAFVVGMFGRSIMKSSMMTIFILVFAGSLAKGVITLFLCYVFHSASVSSVLSIIIPETFYNVLIAPPLFVLFDKLFEKELEREGAR